MGQQSIQFRPRAAAHAAGIGSTSAKTELIIEGMTCGNCARHATDALQSVEGVALAAVDLARSHATIRWKPGSQPTLEALHASIAKAGFTSRLAPTQAHGTSSNTHSGPSSSTQPPNPWRRPLTIGIPATVLLLAADWLLGLGTQRAFHWFSFAIALPVQIIAGAGFYRGAWSQLKARSANMDTLVSLGSTAAFGFSVWALFSQSVPHLFFTEAVTILTLISLGHWMESRMAARAGEALKALLQLAPHRARKLSPTASPTASPNLNPSLSQHTPLSQTGTGVSFDDWTESDTPADSLVPGDIIALKPGDRVPVDALVLAGNSAIDESMLTGESNPVDKSPGTQVLAGTLNASGRLIARVQATGEGTALASIVLAVQRAQNSRASIQRLADRVSSIFVPIVVSIAILAASAWIFAPEATRALHERLAASLWHVHLPDSPIAAAFYVFCSVLIVACPCAMGIATPVALMAGVNAAARRGILIRDAQALEKSGTVNTVVFDKTGTLTEGKPRVTHFDSANSDLPSEWLQSLAASLARHSQHPLSKAIANQSQVVVPLKCVQELGGSGVQGELDSPVPPGINTRTLRLGSWAWLESSGVVLPKNHPALDTAFAQGATLVGLAIGSQLHAWFALRDTLRPQAIQLVHSLRQGPLHFQVHLLSGDHSTAVQAIAREVFADGFTAGVRPEQKADQIRELQSKGLKVAFVGDGINDAPALAQADLGIAVGRATDAAREAADIVLLRADLSGVQDALLLSKATLRTIRQNLFWAFFYNAAAVPLAALGLLSPIVCALSMGLSDVIVIGNALRLSRKKV